MKTHKIRIYWEDTDAGGVVYYANYLNFAERARTEYLRECGINQSSLIDEKGICFVVRKVTCELLKPARLDDFITVETSITANGGASLTMFQEIKKGAEILAKIEVLIACVDKSFKPARLPEDIKNKLSI